MKTKFHFCCILVFALGLLAPKTNAQELIQFWDFNQVRPTSGAGTDSVGTPYSYTNTLGVDSNNATWPLYANYVQAGLTAGHIVYFRPSNFNGILDVIGNPGGGSFLYDYSSNKYSYFTSPDSDFTEGNAFLKALNPADSCTMTLYIPTKGFKNITMQYAIEVSSTNAPTYNILSYSTDSGSTWKNLTGVMDTFNTGGRLHPDTLLMVTSATHGNWYPVQINFTSDTNVNNSSKFALRFTITGPTSLGSSGNDRYDNISIWGDSLTHMDSITAINEIAAHAVGCNLYPNPANAVLNINAQLLKNQTANIYLYNSIGQMVKSEELKNNYTTLSVNDLPDGIYLSRVIDNKGNLVQINKIVITH